MDRESDFFFFFFFKFYFCNIWEFLYLHNPQPFIGKVFYNVNQLEDFMI